MSDRQKIRKAYLEENEGAYPRDAIRSATTVIMNRLGALQKELSRKAKTP